MSDIAGNIGNAIIKPERGNRRRIVAATRLHDGIATTDYRLSKSARPTFIVAQGENAFGKDFSLADSVVCGCCVVHLEHPDRVPSPVWWRVSYFFDRDGKEANVFVWSEPEKQFFRRSQEWFNKRSR
jgi:hypothetical protein